MSDEEALALELIKFVMTVRPHISAHDACIEVEDIVRGLAAIGKAVKASKEGVLA